MKKWLVVLVLVLLLISWFIYLRLDHPSNAAIKREFLQERPNVEIVNLELIFDWEPKKALTYLVKYKEQGSNEVKMSDFTIQQGWDSRWRWCSDQTERKCG